MKYTKIPPFLFFFVMYGFFGVVPALYAQGSGFFTPAGYETLVELFLGILDVVVLLAFPVIILMIIYSAFLLILAQGKENELIKARQAILWTLVGSVTVLAARPIVSALADMLESIVRG